MFLNCYTLCWIKNSKLHLSHNISIWSHVKEIPNIPSRRASEGYYSSILNLFLVCKYIQNRKLKPLEHVLNKTLLLAWFSILFWLTLCALYKHTANLPGFRYFQWCRLKRRDQSSSHDLVSQLFRLFQGNYIEMNPAKYICKIYQKFQIRDKFSWNLPDLLLLCTKPCEKEQ